ncbi:MAG TPA: zinc-dependent metalloprotease [Actinomycetota bacterium]|nr:zinc-dependent metalloprotease [Actinomycetota bacterium]
MAHDSFGDIPLFREIQRIMAAGTGPVNLEIARQVAVALASEGGAEPEPDPGALRVYEDDLRALEYVLAGYTRLPLVEPMRASLATRSGWARTTLDAWRWLFEAMSRRFTAELGRLQGDAEAAGPLRATMGQIAPLLLGIQAGTLVGHLARESTGRYDVPIPRDDDGKLFWIDRNVRAVAQEHHLDPGALRSWLVLHDAARHLVAATVPWLDRYHRSLLADVVDAIEIDASDLERRLVEMQSKGMETLEEGMGAETALPIAPTERHRRAVARLHGLVALCEGYARHAREAVADEAVGDLTVVDAAMARRGATTSAGEALLSGLTGVAPDRGLERAGATFCAAVARLHGPAALNRVWDAPDDVPSIDEIRDPFTWMERVLGA